MVAGCDLGTLDSFSEEQAVEGTEEATLQSRALWKFYEKGSDDTVKRAIDDVQGVVARAGALPLQVKIGDLTADDLALIGKTADPAAPQGMLLVDDLDCTLDQVERLVVAKNQTELYPDLYDAYTRTYVTNVQDLLMGKSPTVVWHTDYTASAVSRTYVAGLTGGARRVPGANPLGGDVILSRTILDNPAKFIAGEDAAFDQDYQIELYYAVEPRKIRHFYALWRQFRIGGLDAESDLYVNLVLGNLRDFDVRTGIICRNDTPPAKFE
jgi:hypothetical protein